MVETLSISFTDFIFNDRYQRNYSLYVVAKIKSILKSVSSLEIFFAEQIEYKSKQ